MFPKPRRKVDKEALESARQHPCMACGRQPPSDPAHIKSRGAGGHDKYENLLSLCRGCHSRQHSRGFVYMWENYWTVEVELRKRGWEVVDGKLVNLKLRDVSL